MGIFAGLNPNLDVSSGFPSYTVELSGPKSELDGFVLTRYSAQIDCSSVKEEGTYELPIRLFLPSDFTVLSASPEFASITFIKKDAP